MCFASFISGGFTTKKVINPQNAPLCTGWEVEIQVVVNFITPWLVNRETSLEQLSLAEFSGE